jgi:hypothetical protein
MDTVKPAMNPFDPAALRIDPASGVGSGVKKVFVNIPVRKPDRQEFFRTHHGQEYHMTAAVLVLKEERETYLVTPDVAHVLHEEIRMVELRLCVTRSGTLFLWPVPLPTEDGRANAWGETARKAAEIAEKSWIRMSANMSAGAYDIFLAPPGLADPTWPEEALSKILEVAFGVGRLIDSGDHPVIKRLQGR